MDWGFGSSGGVPVLLPPPWRTVGGPRVGVESKNGAKKAMGASEDAVRGCPPVLLGASPRPSVADDLCSSLLLCPAPLDLDFPVCLWPGAAWPRSAFPFFALEKDRLFANFVKLPTPDFLPNEGDLLDLVGVGDFNWASLLPLSGRFFDSDAGLAGGGGVSRSGGFPVLAEVSRARV